MYDLQVKAADIDEKCGFRYEIDGPIEDKNVFTMNFYTGLIKTSEKLDFETNPNYSIQLKVWNKVKDPNATNFGLSTLIVNVTDVNEPPYFIEPSCLTETSPCQYEMEENKIDKIVQVKASDPDRVECSLTYEIVSSGDRYFEIHSDSGEIMTKENGVDREFKSCYHIDVAVFDCGEPRLYEKKKIILMVTDKNDNFPVFAQNYTKNIREDTKINSSVLEVVATGEERTQRISCATLWSYVK